MFYHTPIDSSPPRKRTIFLFEKVYTKPPIALQFSQKHCSISQKIPTSIAYCPTATIIPVLKRSFVSGTFCNSPSRHTCVTLAKTKKNRTISNLNCWIFSVSTKEKLHFKDFLSDDVFLGLKAKFLVIISFQKSLELVSDFCFCLFLWTPFYLI